MPASAQAVATQDGTFSFGAQCTGSDCLAVEAHVVANNITVPNNVAGLCLRAMNGNAAPYLIDAYNEWSQWNGTTFAGTTAPAGALICSSPYAPDKSTLTAPSSGSLINAAGTWTFGPACSGGGYDIFLNGADPWGWCSNEYTIDNDGQFYILGLNGTWWQYNTTGWVNTNSTTQP